MKDLSLYVLDIAQNSVKAGAAHLEIRLEEDAAGWLTIVIKDDGCGMPPEFVLRATDPFTTTRTTRRVGMGLPLYRLAAEQTGGALSIASKQAAPGSPAHGTTVTARFDRRSVDCPPLGDMGSTVAALLQGSPALELSYLHRTPLGQTGLSTEQMRRILGSDVPLNAPEVLGWVREAVNG